MGGAGSNDIASKRGEGGGMNRGFARQGCCHDIFSHELLLPKPEGMSQVEDSLLAGGGRI